jgi:Fe-S-cluster containining protein
MHSSYLAAVVVVRYVPDERQPTRASAPASERPPDRPVSQPEDDGAPPGSVGTEALHASVRRSDLERALRRAMLGVDSVRDDVIQLAAHVVALTDELERRFGSIDDAVERALPAKLEEIRVTDERSLGRLLLGDAEDKYRAEPAGPDCTALLPICKARCCKLHFWLSTQDLDEGVIRWDYGRPYMIRQRIDDDYCVHNDPERHGCTVYDHRPLPCRRYDCRNDKRIWADFDNHIPADDSPFARKDLPTGQTIDLVERVRARQLALAMESFSLQTREAERTRHEKKQG